MKPIYADPLRQRLCGLGFGANEGGVVCYVGGVLLMILQGQIMQRMLLELEEIAGQSNIMSDINLTEMDSISFLLVSSFPQLHV